MEKNKILYGSQCLFSWDNVPGTDEERVIKFLRDNHCIAWAKNARYLFSWDNVPGNDKEKLLRFLRDDLNIGWVEDVEIHKGDDSKTISIIKDENSAEITLDEKEEKATLKITNGKTYVLKVKEENGKLNIYNMRIRKSADGKTICIYKDDKSTKTDDRSVEITLDEKKEKATLKIGDYKTILNLKVKEENGKLNIYGDDDRLERINKLTLIEESFRRHYHELAGYRYVLTQQIDLEEKKKNIASTTAFSFFAVLVAFGLAIYQGVFKEVSLPWLITLPILLMLLIALHNYLSSAVKAHEVKDAMYLCLGIDEDEPEMPATMHQEIEKALDLPKLADP